MAHGVVTTLALLRLIRRLLSTSLKGVFQNDESYDVLFLIDLMPAQRILGISAAEVRGSFLIALLNVLNSVFAARTSSRSSSETPESPLLSLQLQISRDWQ